MFQKGLWEPGHTEVVALKFKNNGNLALKYSINMHIVNETADVNKAGQDYKLSDYLQVKTLSQEASRIGDISFLRLTDALSGATMRKVRKVIPIQPKGASIWDETTGTL